MGIILSVCLMVVATGGLIASAVIIRDLTIDSQMREGAIMALSSSLADMAVDYRPAPSLITVEDFLLDGGEATITLHDVMITTVAESGSMLPWIYAGTTIALERTNDVRAGDVAVYEKEDGGCVIHRIIGEQGEYWIFKGDNNPTTEVIEKSRVTYRLVAVFY